MVKNKKCQKLTDCRSSNVNKPQLKSGTKKRKKTIPITRDDRSIIEIRKARRNVQLCIPKLSLARSFFFLCVIYTYMSQKYQNFVVVRSGNLFHFIKACQVHRS